MELEQIDIKTAFLNGVLSEELYIRLPPPLQGKYPGKVCRCIKSLYGLCQAQRVWFTAIDHYLKSVGFMPSLSDPCLYILRKDSLICFVIIFVDDGIIACNNKTFVKEFITRLNKKYKLRHLGALSYFLGLNITRDRNSRSLKIDQATYVQKLLVRHGLQDCKGVTTPGPSFNFTKEVCPGTPIKEKEEYASLVAALLYAMRGSRPDIAASLSTLCKFTANPSKEMWVALKRVLRYLKQTLA